ncbi:hypothetical protein SAMN05920897_11018 [Alkalispirochaeta americana]|uniref:FlgN protein n=1 Tax=Alkalispirochaeta americana TaxID=159291 RepID=A0A1N6TE03_9SPIO|nr:hypothetical protein [Alkalispirochaeta americana]SIQ51553.1 hypothetical protein SAMN05920897_11018 [Alkalispirochaeta americana]
MTKDRLEDYRGQAKEHLLRYLDLLERQHQAITEGDTDRLEALVLESGDALAGLESVQRVLAAREREPASGERAEMESLVARAREQQKKNEECLRERRDDLGRRITELRIPRRARSVFAPPAHGGRSIDLTR